MATVSVVIPTRNEQKNIRRAIIGVRKYCPECNIIVVDDSDDNATVLSALYEGAEVISGQHKGLGQAIIDGLRASKSDVTIVMDADLSHPASKLPELVEACLNGHGMAIGSRYVKGGGTVGWSFKRRLISRVASFLALPISGVRDGTSGFFAVRTSLLDGVDIQPDSWKIMLEVLVKTKAKAIEIPIEFQDRRDGKSKFNKKEMLAYLKHLVKLVFYKHRVLNFMVVGGIGYLVNMAVYYPLTLWFKNTVTFLGQEFYLPPFVVSSFVAITSNYLMNKRFTFGDRKVKTAGYWKYLTTCSISLPVEMALIFLFVHFLNVFPVCAVALAILIVFMARYAIVKKFVWHKGRS